MRLTLAATLLCLSPTALAGPATAQSSRGPIYLSMMGEPFVGSQGQSPFALWMAGADRDKDGSVSLAELAIDADRFFKTLDVDADGRIGGIEMTRYEQEIAPAGLRARAGMKPVGSEEAKGPVRTYQVNDRGMPRSGRDGLPGGMDGPRLVMEENPEQPRSQYSGLSGIPQPVAMTDTDMSGSVTAEEFTRAATRRFATADGNKNGLLDSNELTRRR